MFLQVSEGQDLSPGASTVQGGTAGGQSSLPPAGYFLSDIPLQDIHFIDVLNPGGDCKTLQLMRISVAGGRREGGSPYRVTNVRFSGVQEGVYVRRGEGGHCRNIVLQQ